MINDISNKEEKIFTTLVDVVNFNADASCLSSKNWLEFIGGGEDSIFYRWLKLYVRYNKKIVLGFTGASIADIVKFNPEAIELINANPKIFQLILRPFAHDISLLRTCDGFRTNLRLGIDTVKREFRNVYPFYLPPEFMCNSTQIMELTDNKVDGVFIHSGRFAPDIRERIPTTPYMVYGILNTSMTCIPFADIWTNAYLSSIHQYTADPWNACLNHTNESVVYTWRDGESAFLLPKSVEREQAWLTKENEAIQRQHLGEVTLTPTVFPPYQSGGKLSTYPIHSFSAWIQEMKMYWYLYRAQKLEESLFTLGNEERAIWLQIISSDILSAVEKKSPKIQLKTKHDSAELIEYTIYRKGKEFEGEEFFQILDNLNTETVRDYYLNSTTPHIVKLRARTEYLSLLNRC